MSGAVVRLVVLAAVVWVGSATPAVADPAGPTNFRATVAEVTAVDGGPVDGVRVEVVGGDAYLVVRAAEQVAVEVPGYDGEPYVRIGPDGVVEVNVRSPAHWLNADRYGGERATMPADASADAPPRWEAVAEGGVYAWHDHRVHFMSPQLPPGVDPDVREVQPVLDWQLPMVVDGDAVEVNGTLTWVPGPPVALGVLSGLLVAAAGLGLAAGGRRWVRWALWGAAAATATVGMLATGSLPDGADVEPALVILPVIALVTLLLGRWAEGRRPDEGRWITLAAGLPVLAWGMLQSGALIRPIVPGVVPIAGVRPVTALAWAAGLACVLQAGRALRGLAPIGHGESDPPAP